MINNTDNRLLNILIIGTGMYVCGRGTNEYGTILPAVYELMRDVRLGKIYIAGTSSASIELLKNKVKELDALFGYKLDIKYFPHNKIKDTSAYKKAIHDIPKPACAIIAIADHLHKKVAMDTIQNGIHTLVVKPLVSNYNDLKALLDIEKKNNVYCAVEYHKRWDRANIQMRDVISRGVIGDLLYFIVEYSQRKSVPINIFKNWVENTNIFQYLGVHYVDIIYFATGAIPKRVQAISQKNLLVANNIDNYDAVQGVIEWQLPNGKKFISYIFTHWVDPETTSSMSNQKIAAIGTKGRFESDQKDRGINIVSETQGIQTPNPYFCSFYNDKKGKIHYYGYGIDSVHQFLKDCIAVEKGEQKIKDLNEIRPSFKQSIVPTKVIEAINKSLRNNGKWVSIS